MNPVRALPFVLLFGSMAFSQSSGKQFSSTSFQSSCPIELKASLNTPGRVLQIVPVEKGRNTSNEQRLRITLSNPKSEVVAAHLTVHGFPIGGRVSPAVIYFPNDPAEIAKAVTFDQTLAAGQSASIDVAVRYFSSVTSISLDSVTYSDGPSWHPKNRKYCRAIGSSIDIAVDTLSH